MKVSVFLTLTFLCSMALSSEWNRQTALSPDGTTILFAAGGDIYQVSSQGGSAQLLIGGEHYQGYPVWSRDGKSIAYSSDSSGNFDVYLYDLSSGRHRQLTFHSASDFPTDFSSDSKEVLFTTSRDELLESAKYLRHHFKELYTVSTEGGLPRVLSPFSLDKAKLSPDGSKILFQDRKAYEDVLRKHHTSSAARDIWLWNKKNQKYTKLTDFAGEDLNPVWSQDGQTVYYLSEKSGTLNIWKKSISGGSAEAITKMEHHPVRDLSIDQNDNLSFSHHGSIYLLKNGTSEPNKVNIQFPLVLSHSMHQPQNNGGKVKEFSLSPNGKEVAMILRGEVYVTSIEFGTTKQITNTAEQERSVSFSPDGRKLIYASERGGSWNLYETKIADPKEYYFYGSTKLIETPLLVQSTEAFGPQYSPDGKEVAYLHDRDELKVLNLRSKKSRTVLSPKFNASYTDFAIEFDWSPDSKWISVTASGSVSFSEEVYLVHAHKKDAPINISLSGYSDNSPQWQMNGKLITWTSQKYGRINHGSWGGDTNVFGLFLTQNAFDEFKKSKEARAFEKNPDEKKKEDKKDDKDKKKKIVKAVAFDQENFESRTIRLTRNSSSLSSSYVTNDGQKMYFMETFSKRSELWVHDFVEETLKKIYETAHDRAFFEVSKDEKVMVVKTPDSLVKLALAEKPDQPKAEPISFKALYLANPMDERDNMFEHIWRQTMSKFYLKDMHGVNWEFMKKEYASRLPAIYNNFDFSVLMSELLGELNASHTGARYYNPSRNKNKTGSLGVLFDSSFKGPGLKIKRIYSQGPLDKKDLEIKEGMLLVSIDGHKIEKKTNYNKLLQNKAGKRVRLGLSQKGWIFSKKLEKVVVPVSQSEDGELKYKEWVKTRREMVDKLSKGQLGYVHIRAMNTRSFQEVYSEALGRQGEKKALIVDTRFNGGGWLHDDLNTFLSGEVYFRFLPRGRHPVQEPIGVEPVAKWTKPSIVVVNEANYSDGYLFPYSYKMRGIGELVGMPVAATGTAVWWERLFTEDIVFGIPQLGVLDNKNQLQENRDLVPDHQVANTYESQLKGKDLQLEKAVSVLMEKVKK